MGQTNEALDMLRRSLHHGGDAERIEALIDEIESRNRREGE
jgi:hypothetical protein